MHMRQRRLRESLIHHQQQMKESPACSALTFRGLLSLRFKHTRTRLHSTHLLRFSAWSHDELANLDRCTFPWHRWYAGFTSNLHRQRRNRGQSDISHIPHAVKTHTHRGKHVAVSHCQSSGLLLHSSFALRLDQDFQKRWLTPRSRMPSNYFMEEKKNGRRSQKSKPYIRSLRLLTTVAPQHANVLQRELRCALRLCPER